MDIYENYKKIIRKKLDDRRYFHSLCVADCAKDLAVVYGACPEQAYVAGLLHDVLKQESRKKLLQYANKFGIIFDNVTKNKKKLWHAVVGSAYIKHKLKLSNEIIDAVQYHTTAKANMSLLCKTLYMADYISNDRDYPGVDELRIQAKTDINGALMTALSFSICELAEKQKPIHPDTIAAYNEIILNIKKDKV